MSRGRQIIRQRGQNEVDIRAMFDSSRSKIDAGVALGTLVDEASREKLATARESHAADISMLLRQVALLSGRVEHRLSVLSMLPSHAAMLALAQDYGNVVSDSQRDVDYHENNVG